MTNLLHVSIRVQQRCFLFVNFFGTKALKCLGALMWSNFWKVRQCELDTHFFVDVFERFVFIALFINVMFLKNFANFF
jgi:hypothetical protein